MLQNKVTFVTPNQRRPKIEKKDITEKIKANRKKERKREIERELK